MTKLSEITVCICTFKRAALLPRLLHSLASQDTGGEFTFSIVVADNDRDESARQAVTEFGRTAPVQVRYCVEPTQNIALARNKAIEIASGEFVVFFDDDQFPSPGWLKTLFDARLRFGVDGVLGPVKPSFEVPPPSWIVKGRFYERATHSTGHVIDWQQGRTGNVLLHRRVFEGLDPVFRPAFLTGEDQDFFRRAIERGHRFVWCAEAVAHEVVPPNRWRRSFMIKRALLRGKVALRHPGAQGVGLLKSAIALPIYGLLLPIGLIAGQHHFMKWLIKLCDHGGKLMAVAGVNPVKEVYITE